MTNINPKRTNIAINAAGGVMTNIILTIMCSKVEIVEDPAYNSGAMQGLTGYIMDTQPGLPTPTINVASAGAPVNASPANLQVWLPNVDGNVGQNYEPIIFGGQDGRVHGAYSDFVGAEGTVPVQLTMNGPNAGGIILTEWP
jgi:hypothetical protein